MRSTSTSGSSSRDHLLKLALIKTPEYAAALARAYNAWLVETWSDRRALLGVVIACPQDPENAAAEIERYADQPGIVGVYLPCAGSIRSGETAATTRSSRHVPRRACRRCSTR